MNPKKKKMMNIKADYTHLLARWRVKSKSKPGKFHIVEVYSDGQYRCDCTAGIYLRECSHKIKVKRYYAKNKFSTTRQ